MAPDGRDLPVGLLRSQHGGCLGGHVRRHPPSQGALTHLTRLTPTRMVLSGEISWIWGFGFFNFQILPEPIATIAAIAELGSTRIDGISLPVTQPLDLEASIPETRAAYTWAKGCCLDEVNSC